MSIIELWEKDRNLVEHIMRLGYIKHTREAERRKREARRRRRYGLAPLSYR